MSTCLLAKILSERNKNSSLIHPSSGLLSTKPIKLCSTSLPSLSLTIAAEFLKRAVSCINMS